MATVKDDWAGFIRFVPARIPELTDDELQSYADHWWMLARQYYRNGDDVHRWRCSDTATYAVLEQARRSGLVVRVPFSRSLTEADRSRERNILLNACVPDDGCGFPLHPALQGLCYPHYGMHLQPLGERRAYEERMRDWVATAACYGLSEEAGLGYSLYL